MSSNPFRRSQQVPATSFPIPSTREDPELPPRPSDDAHPLPSPPQARKSVRISSPADSPNAAAYGPQDVLIQRIRQGSHSGSPPPSISGESADSPGDAPNDPFEKALEEQVEDSIDPEVMENTRRNSGVLEPLASPSGAPPNPFQRTLANMEPHRHVSFSQPKEEKGERPLLGKLPAGNTRASLDVDAFKRLLMTGSAAPNPVSSSPSSTQPAPQTVAGIVESSSSTDTSSISRQSLFEPVPELHETPRTSYEISRSDDEEQVSLVGEGRKPKKKPPPPRHRHGKLVTSRTPQTVSFADFTTSVSSPSRPAASQTGHQRRSSDLNKPLPPPPPVSSTADAEKQSIDERESITSISPLPSESMSPNTPSTPRSASDPQLPAKRAPPPVPLARRQSQLRTSNPTSSNNRSRSNSSLTVSSQHSETNAALSQPSHKSPPPPPPPTRRHAGSSASALSSAATSTVDVPATSRSRGPTAAASTTSPYSPPSTTTTATAALSHSPGAMAPPPPPPRNRGSSRGSLDLKRSETAPAVVGSPSASESAADSSTTTTTPLDRHVSSEPNVKDPPQEALPDVSDVSDVQPAVVVDVLADMERLQAEVDALRERFREVGGAEAETRAPAAGG